MAIFKEAHVSSRRHVLWRRYVGSRGFSYVGQDEDGKVPVRAHVSDGQGRGDDGPQDVDIAGHDRGRAPDDAQEMQRVEAVAAALAFGAEKRRHAARTLQAEFLPILLLLLLLRRRRVQMQSVLLLVVVRPERVGAAGRRGGRIDPVCKIGFVPVRRQQACRLGDPGGFFAVDGPTVSRWLSGRRGR